MQVNIPDKLAIEIKRLISEPTSPEDFVLQAVREKLSWEDRRREFYRLSDETRGAMIAQGLSEEDIWKDFDGFRHQLSAQGRG